MPDEWCASVLKSRKDGWLYTGSTNDLQRRLAEHIRGQRRYTAHRGPFDLVYTEKCDHRPEARRRARYLKTGVGREFLQSRLPLDTVE